MVHVEPMCHPRWFFLYLSPKFKKYKEIPNEIRGWNISVMKLKNRKRCRRWHNHQFEVQTNKRGNKISQIVHLKQVVQRWLSLHPLHPLCQISCRLRWWRTPLLRHYTHFLNLLVFVSLLNKVEEEFGFQTTDRFVLPCDVVFFKELLNVLEREKSGFGALDLDDFSEMFSDLASDSYSLCKKDTIYDAHIFTSLL